METLWSPWRITYITGPKVEGCILCEKWREQKDRENLVLYRGAHNYVLMNLYPYNPGHLMVVPYEHLARLDDLPPGVAAEMTFLTQYLLQVIDRAVRPDGYNLGVNLGHVAGAGIDAHVHQHIVPRWDGDTSFMPAVGETKVMPESLEQTYDKLRAAWKP